MSEPRLTLDSVRVHRVWRRGARAAARAAVGAMVLPVVLMMVAVPLRGAFAYGEHLLSGALVAWAAGWLGAPVLGVLSWLLALRRRLPVATAEVESGHLRLVGGGADVTIPREEMTGALLVSREEDGEEVEVALASRNTLSIRPAGVGQAAQLVEALGFGVEDRRVAIPLGGPREPLSAGCGGVLVGLLGAVLATCGTLAVTPATYRIGDVLPYVIGAVFVGVTLAVARALTPRRLVIGKDGVLFEGPFRKRFFPRASIFGAEWIGQHVALLIGGGDDVREVQITSESGERQAALLRRIRAALDLPESGADPRAAVLARGGETIERWRARLRRLTAPERGYRGESIPRETLVQTAADAGAKAEVRVGAALAIGLGDDAAAKAELRRSIEAIASDKLRVALEAAASGEADEEALAAAVAEEGLAQQEGRPKRALPVAEAPEE